MKARRATRLARAYAVRPVPPAANENERPSTGPRRFEVSPDAADGVMLVLSLVASAGLVVARLAGVLP